MAPLSVLTLSVLTLSVLTLSVLTLTSSALPFYQHPSVTSSNGLSWLHGSLEAGRDRPSSSGYQCFHGDIANYPALGDWLSFDEMWKTNAPVIAEANSGDGNRDVVGWIRDAITTVAKESKVNARLILAAVMQESTGRASVSCTHSGEILNCGLMQASYNSHSFDPSSPETSILTMIREGVQGTSSGGPTGQGGPGYAQYLQGLRWVEDAWPGNPYAAARAYNSGTVGPNLDVVEYGIPGYANDVANRLTGWDGRGGGFEGCGRA